MRRPLRVPTAVLCGLAALTVLPAGSASAAGLPKLVIHAEHRTTPIFAADIGVVDTVLQSAVVARATLTTCAPGTHVQMTASMTQDGRDIEEFHGGALGYGEYDCDDSGSFTFFAEFTDPGLHPGRVRLTFRVFEGAVRADTKSSQASIPG